MKRFALLVLMLGLSMTGCAEKAPSNEAVTAAVRKLMPVPFQVLEVSQTPQIKSLYQVVIRVDRQPVVFYIDKEAKFVFSGSLVSVDTKLNLTSETQKKYLPK